MYPKNRQLTVSKALWIPIPIYAHVLELQPHALLTPVRHDMPLLERVTGIDDKLTTYDKGVE